MGGPALSSGSAVDRRQRWRSQPADRWSAPGLADPAPQGLATRRRAARLVARDSLRRRGGDHARHPVSAGRDRTARRTPADVGRDLPPQRRPADPRDPGRLLAPSGTAQLALERRGGLPGRLARCRLPRRHRQRGRGDERPGGARRRRDLPGRVRTARCCAAPRVAPAPRSHRRRERRLRRVPEQDAVVRHPVAQRPGLRAPPGRSRAHGTHPRAVRPHRHVLTETCRSAARRPPRRAWPEHRRPAPRRRAPDASW